MTYELFIAILVMSATATSIAVEIIKSILDKIGIPYESISIAVLTAFVVGFLEIILYYMSHGIALSGITILYSICMGIANSVGATTSYDLIKKLISALIGKTD